MKETTMDDDKQTVEMVLDLAGGEWRFQITRDAARNSMRALAKGLGLELIEMAAVDDFSPVRRLALERDAARKELAIALEHREIARSEREAAIKKRDHWREELNAMRIARDDAVASRDAATRDFYRVISERDEAQAAVAEGKAVMYLRDAELAQARAERDRILGGYLTLSDLAEQMWRTARKLEEDRNGFRDRDGKAKP